MILSNIAEKYKIMNISTNNIMRDKWFIGSALMGIDIRTLSIGKYFYKQDTIWAKAFQFKEINPYWEIHNRTENILCVGVTKLEINDIILSVLEEIRMIEKINFCDIILLCSKDEILTFFKNRVRIKKAKINFYMEGKVVGEYIKIFINKGNIFFPYLDCTLFTLSNQMYFEINFNYYYQELIDLITQKKIPNKIKKGMELLDIDNFNYNYVYNPEYIRLFSLLDALLFIEQNGGEITSNYSGHTVKKIIKELCCCMNILEYDIKLLKKRVLNNHYKYMMDEQKRLNEEYPNLINSYDYDILKDRYGMPKRYFDYLNGVIDVKYCVNQKNVRYFTDIPFIDDLDDIEMLFKILEKVIRYKK